MRYLEKGISENLSKINVNSADNDAMPKNEPFH